MGKQIVLFGAGEECKKLIQLIGKERIKNIYDNDPNKVGKNIDGIEIRAFEKTEVNRLEVCITPNGLAAEEIAAQLKSCGKRYVYKDDLLSRMLRPNKYIERYKGTHVGEKCFLVGTGPSLTIEDLNAINRTQFFCFGANRIFKVFDSTVWRPNVYCVIDYKVIREYFDTFIQMSDQYDFFISDVRDTNYLSEHENELFEENFNNVFHLIYQNKSASEMGFSYCPEKYIVDGMTVIYAMIQLARYMGFDEMYLVGVDFNYSDPSGKDYLSTDHCCKDYINPDEVVNPPHLEVSRMAFETAERISKKDGFRIFNATRGGRLEVFERKNLDEVIENASIPHQRCGNWKM